MYNFNNDILTILYKNDIIEYVDLCFAGLIGQMFPKTDPDVLAGIALTSRVTGDGDVCLDLKKWADKPLVEAKIGSERVVCPEFTVWMRKLRRCPAVGEPAAYRPLIVDPEGRLYLYRYWQYETRLAAAIKEKIDSESLTPDLSELRASLDCFFPDSDGSIDDEQKLAAVTAVLKRLCVITGGPGTGKTTTAGNILGLLAKHHYPENLNIQLAAPTGKAAARLGEAIRKVKSNLPVTDEMKQSIPETAQTIHRLLKAVPDSPHFRHNQENPLKANVIVIDEASMIDLALMAKLFSAVPKDTRLILMGDKDQLASVEAGAVLGDICDRERHHPYSSVHGERIRQFMTSPSQTITSSTSFPAGLQDHLVNLTKNYRFSETSTLAAFSRAVNAGLSEKALETVKSTRDNGIAMHSIRTPAALDKSLAKVVLREYTAYLSAEDPLTALNRFDRFRILCALKSGPFGVETVNRKVETILARNGLIDIQGRFDHHTERSWYKGRPILITRNDYQIGLFNGDVGIAFPDDTTNDGEIRVFFQIGDRGLCGFSPHRLPEHRTAFAMTVHKSQGSEFENVVIVFPDKDFPVLTRELVYTATTRAKRSVDIWCTEEIFTTAVNRKIQRASGLRKALWESGMEDST